MSTVSSSPIKAFPAADAVLPEKLHPLDRAFGLLSSVTSDEDGQIAQIDSRLGTRIILLPLDFDLSEYIGHEIGMTREGNRFLVRKLSEAQS